MCFEVSGTILGVLVYTAYYLGLATRSDCVEGERTPDNSLRAAYRWHALTLSVLIVIFVFTTFVGVREQKGQYSVWEMGVENSPMSEVYLFHFRGIKN